MLVGDCVILHGLSKAAHLNGLHGRVALVCGAGSGGRIEVVLDNDTHVKVLGKNLALLPRYVKSQVEPLPLRGVL